MFWFIEQDKNITHVSFVINRSEIFRTIFQAIAFMIAKKNISQAGHKGEPKAIPSI